jgi:hypothetical protein
MRFWGLGIPDYASDYESSNLNGEIETDIRLPSVDCEVCMMTWGYAGLRSVPFECPEMLRGEMSSKGDRQSVFREEHFDLQRRLFEEAGVQGRPFTDIRPGYRFPPPISTSLLDPVPTFFGLLAGCWSQPGFVIYSWNSAKTTWQPPL